EQVRQHHDALSRTRIEADVRAVAARSSVVPDDAFLTVVTLLDVPGEPNRLTGAGRAALREHRRERVVDLKLLEAEKGREKRQHVVCARPQRAGAGQGRDVPV